jgi:hypothetical protein
MGTKKRKQKDPATNGKQNSATDSMLSLTSNSSQKNVVSNFTVSSSGKKFLMPQDGAEFDKLLKEKYRGFIHIPASQLTPHDFHQRSRAALERLRDANYYQYDVIMAGGKHSSRTFVKRTLVGDPGITYKYLGLRLFAHAWSGSGFVPPVLKDIGDMNQRMIEMTKQQGGKHSKYNLTLINYMEPSSHTKIGFKDEPQYGMYLKQKIIHWVGWLLFCLLFLIDICYIYESSLSFVLQAWGKYRSVGTPTRRWNRIQILACIIAYPRKRLPDGTGRLLCVHTRMVRTRMCCPLWRRPRTATRIFSWGRLTTLTNTRFWQALKLIELAARIVWQ